MRRFVFAVLALMLAASTFISASANSTALFSCRAQQGAAVEGVTPSSECNIEIRCPIGVDVVCGVFGPHLDVDGTGVVEGAMTLVRDISGFTVNLGCSAPFHCEDFEDGLQFFMGKNESARFRCAANGVALLLGATCSVTVTVQD